MENLLADSSNRGFSAERELRRDRITNYLVFRSIDSSSELELVDSLKNISSDIPFKNISLYGRIGFKYCPWCGRPQ